MKKRRPSYIDERQMSLFEIANGSDEFAAMQAIEKVDIAMEGISNALDDAMATNGDLHTLLSDAEAKAQVEFGLMLRSGGASLEEIQKAISERTDEAAAVMAAVAYVDTQPEVREAMQAAELTLGKDFAKADLNAPAAPQPKRKRATKAAPTADDAEELDTEESEDDMVTALEAADSDPDGGAEGDDIAGESTRRARGEGGQGMQLIFNSLNNSRFDMCTIEQERELGKRSSAGDIAARNELVERHTRFLLRAASRYRKYGRSLEELFQAGSLGMMRAAEKFDPALGFRFTTYADFWVRQSIQRYLANDQIVRTPEFVATRESRARKAAKAASDSGDQDLAKRMTAEADGYGRMRTNAKSFVTMDTGSSSEDEERGLHELLSGEEIGMEEQAEARKLIQWLISASHEVENDRAGIVFRMRLGLHEDHEDQPLDMQEVANHLGCTRENVRQLYARAADEVVDMITNWARGESNLPDGFSRAIKTAYGRGA